MVGVVGVVGMVGVVGVVDLVDLVANSIAPALKTESLELAWDI